MPSPLRRGKWNTCTYRCAIALRQWCAVALLCLTSLLVTTASVTSVAADSGVSSASAKANGTTTVSNPYAGQILFSPSVIALNNPTGDRRVAFTGSTPVTVTIGGTTLAASDVLYAGLSPGSITGLYQFNVRIHALQ